MAAFGSWARQSGLCGVGANSTLADQYLINLVEVASGVSLGKELTANTVLNGAVIIFGVCLTRNWEDQPGSLFVSPYRVPLLRLPPMTSATKG